jgi:hypothetical protein
MLRRLWALSAFALLGCNALTGANDLEEVEDLDAQANETAPLADTAPEENDSAAIEDTSDTGTIDAGSDTTTAPPLCENGKLDPGEADVDCGKACSKKCAEGKSCTVDKDCATGHCVGGQCALCPAKMVAISSGTTHFCVDVDEVTNAEYKAFLASTPATVGQPIACTWNDSYVPGSSASLPVWPVALKYDPYPVRFVDWCDAYAYCKWAGKRLCGKIGGGAVGYDSDFANAGVSEWMRACSTGGANTYTYAGSFDATKCNSKGSGYSATVAAGSLPLCKNTYGNHDMSGNVSEWEDDCQATSGASDLCHPRGGSYGTLDPRCAVVETYARSAQTQWTGVRCCSD